MRMDMPNPADLVEVWEVSLESAERELEAGNELQAVIDLSLANNALLQLTFLQASGLVNVKKGVPSAQHQPRNAEEVQQ